MERRKKKKKKTTRLRKLVRGENLYRRGYGQVLAFRVGASVTP